MGRRRERRPHRKRASGRRPQGHHPSNPSTSGFTGKPALVLDRPGGIPQGYGLTSRRSVTEPRWVSSPPSYCATAPLSRVVSPRRPVRFQSLPKSSFRVRTRLRRERSSMRARHPIAQGCRASPARSRPARMAIRRAIATASTSQRRPTWHLASSRCCAGNGPEFLATMAAVMKMSLRRARWLVLCRRACVALDALLKTPILCPLVRVSVRTMRSLLIAR